MFRESLTPIIETERLRLRGHRATDLANLVAMWSEEAVTRFTVGRTLNEEEIWMRMLRHVGHWTLMGFGYWIVEEKAGEKLLGEAGMAEFHRDIELSLVGTPAAGWVFAPEAHGKGFALEATKAILTWGKERFGNSRSVCIINPANAPSLNLAAKLGYLEEARTEFRGKPAIVLGRG